MDMILYGAGGHAKTVAAVVESLPKFRIVGFLDDDQRKHGTEHFGYPVLGDWKKLSEQPLSGVEYAFAAVGDNQCRAVFSRKLVSQGKTLVTLVDPQAVLLRGAALRSGTVVFPRAVIGADARVGKGAIISIGAVLSHDSQVGDYSHLAPGVTLGGGARVGNYSFLGINAVVLPGVEIADHVVIGANALVNHDLPSGVTAVGSPARIIKRSKDGS
jgi:sugar O-acyltransferase (sialic acid O-acetyltransferase NeuD family)